MRVFDLGADTPCGKPRQRAAFERFLAGVPTDGRGDRAAPPSGRAIWVRLSVRPMRDAAGNVVATRSSALRLHRAQASPRRRCSESEERLARILHSAMDAIVTFDERPPGRAVQRGGGEDLPRAAADAIGASLERFLGAALRARARRRDARVRGSGERPLRVGPGGLAARRADGSEFPVEATLSHVEVGGRQLFTLILRDVDQRRRAEEELRQLNLQNEYLQEEIKAAHNVDEIVGQSRALADGARAGAAGRRDRLLGAAARRDRHRQGAGRARGASRERAHATGRSSRSTARRCPPGLIESELFGHEKGAFTGATERRIGRFELADGGTIFLDEIGELPLEIQVKLLRVLQEREFERARRTADAARRRARHRRDQPRPAARRSPTARSAQDLYYRLNVFPVRIPPLRERARRHPAAGALLRRAATPAKIGRKITRVAARDHGAAASPTPGRATCASSRT